MMLVILTALVGGVVGAAIGTTTLAALVGALTALVLLIVGRFVFELARYRLSGWKDETWVADAARLTDDRIQFSLTRRQDALPTPITALGVMECVAQGPSGVKVWSDRDLFPVKLHAALAEWEGASAGAYEVRWYGSKRRNKFYEVARGTFTIDHPSFVKAS